MIRGFDSQGFAEIGRRFESVHHAYSRGKRNLLIKIEPWATLLVLLTVTIGTCWLAHSLHTGAASMLGALSIAAFALSLFAAFGWLLYVVHPWFRRWWVRVLFGCVLFVWGFTTFFYFPVESSDADDFTARILRATNRTSMTMIAKGRAYGKPLSLSARVNYGAFQTAVIFYMAAILLSIFGRTAMNNLQKLFVMHEDLLHVFWGLSERDRLLARSIHTAVPETCIEFNLPKSVMYNPLEQARLTDLADELGAFWTFVNLPPKQSQQASAGKSAALSRRFYRRLVSVLSDWFALSVTKGRYHYFLGDDGHANMAMAQILAERIIDNDFAYGEWRFFVRAGNIDNEGLFTAWAEGVYKKLEKWFRYLSFVMRN